MSVAATTVSLPAHSPLGPGAHDSILSMMQVTSLMTPTLSTLAGERPGRQVWLGCIVAMAGTVLLTLDHAPQAASSGLQQAAFGAHPSECLPASAEV